VATDAEILRERAESEIKKRRLNDSDANALRSMVNEQIKQNHDARIAELTKMGPQNPLAVGVANFANAGTFGYLPQIVSALTPGDKRQEIQDALEASRITNPVASTVGELGGVVKGAAGKLAGAVGGLATRAASPLASLVGAAPVAAAKVAGAGTGAVDVASFAGRASMQFLKNMAGAAGALGTFNALENRPEERSSASARIAQFTSDVSNPLTLGMSAGAGVFSAALGGRVDPDIKRIVEKFERRTGQKVTADVVNDTAGMKMIFDAAQVGAPNELQRVRLRLTSGLRDYVRKMRTDFDAGDASKARDVIEDFTGTRKTISGVGSSSKITNARRGAQAVAFGSDATKQIERASAQMLHDDLGRILGSTRRTDKVGGALIDVVDDLKKYLNPYVRMNPNLPNRVGADAPTLSVDDLEGIRNRLSRLAFVTNPLNPADPNFSDGSRKVAQRLYLSVTSAMYRTSNSVERSMKLAERSRRIEEAFSGVSTSDLDDRVVRSFWSGDKPLERFTAVEKVASPDDIAAVKGSLFNMLMESVADPNTGLVNQRNLNRVTKAAGPLNRQVINRVMPGLLDEMQDIAKLSFKMQEGVFSPRGSQTAGRARTLLMGGVAASEAAIAATIAMAEDPMSRLPLFLGANGLAWVIHSSMKSLIGGRLGSAMVDSRLGRGLPNLPPIAPVVANKAQESLLGSPQ